MSRTIHKTDKPVTLEGFQAVVAPSKFGYSLAAVVGGDTIETLEQERIVAIDKRINELTGYREGLSKELAELNEPQSLEEA